MEILGNTGISGIDGRAAEDPIRRILRAQHFIHRPATMPGLRPLTIVLLAPSLPIETLSRIR